MATNTYTATSPTTGETFVKFARTKAYPFAVIGRRSWTDEDDGAVIVSEHASFASSYEKAMAEARTQRNHGIETVVVETVEGVSGV